MKPETGLIFSLLLAGHLAAECTKLETSIDSRRIWAEYSNRFKAIPLPQDLGLCIGRRYFYEVKGGARMTSALDRQRKRIIMRHYDTRHLRHEVAHLYLDLAWRVLPYHTSEHLVRFMQTEPECKHPPKMPDELDVQHRWRNRQTSSSCELEQLLRDILTAPAATQDKLPLH